MKSDKGSFGRKGLFKSVNRCIDLKDLFTLHWILFSFFCVCVFKCFFSSSSFLSTNSAFQM